MCGGSGVTRNPESENLPSTQYRLHDRENHSQRFLHKADQELLSVTQCISFPLLHAHIYSEYEPIIIDLESKRAFKTI